MENIQIKVDPFLTMTRIEYCEDFTCQFHEKETFECLFRKIEIGEEGKCKNRVILSPKKES